MAIFKKVKEINGRRSIYFFRNKSFFLSRKESEIKKPSLYKSY